MPHIEETDGPVLGPCCNCERMDGVYNIVMINRRGPTDGRGWGCMVCGLPCDGAIAVLCDDCADVYPPRFACVGYPALDGRVPFHDLPPGDFKHDTSKHDLDD